MIVLRVRSAIIPLSCRSIRKFPNAAGTVAAPNESQMRHVLRENVLAQRSHAGGRLAEPAIAQESYILGELTDNRINAIMF